MTREQFNASVNRDIAHLMSQQPTITLTLTAEQALFVHEMTQLASTAEGQDMALDIQAKVEEALSLHDEQVFSDTFDGEGE